MSDLVVIRCRECHYRPRCVTDEPVDLTEFTWSHVDAHARHADVCPSCGLLVAFEEVTDV